MLPSAEPTSPEVFRKLVKDLTTHGRALSPAELDVVFRAATAIQRQLDLKARAFTSPGLRQRPLLYVYMSDGWGGSISQVFTQKIGEHDCEKGWGACAMSLH